MSRLFIWSVWSLWFLWFLKFSRWVRRSGHQDKPALHSASGALLALCPTDQTDRPPPFPYISVLGQTTQNPELITQNFPKRAG
jgi:hypothetical protein